MRVTFLGTGTSQGIPVIACDCPVCQSKDIHDKRLRTSVLIEVDDLTLVIDTGPDFRQQMLRAKVQKLDAVLYTHEHKDHTAGMDDVRSFNFKQKKDMPIYAREKVLEQLKREFAYVFAEHKYPDVPSVEPHIITNMPFCVEDLKVTPIEVLHYKLPVFGFRIKDFTYITDANAISDAEMSKIKNSEVIVINALQKEDHISHFTLQQALEVIEQLQPKQAYLTHISHKMGFHAEVSKELPPHVALAYDGLSIEL
ncbi:MAG: MBL fold metallo-hydrolase [Bacteroidota bacterium]